MIWRYPTAPGRWWSSPTAAGAVVTAPANRWFAEQLRQVGLGTLLLDLLTQSEEAVDDRTGELRFDIDLLAGRLVDAVACLDNEGLGHLHAGYFGASPGAGAALVAAARQGARIGAVVSRRGRPDLAGDALGRVEAPTLLIVGGRDEVVVGLNRQAKEELRCQRRLEIVPGATHLLEEPGAARSGRPAARQLVHRAPGRGGERRGVSGQASFSKGIRTEPPSHRFSKYLSPPSAMRGAAAPARSRR